MNSRRIEDLHPAVAAKAREFLRLCERQWPGNEVDVIITSTMRSMAEQERLYAQGRTAPGKIVTKAKPGQSMHNYGLAFDVVPLRYGKPVWGTTGADGELWNRIGQIGESVGLEWAGRWQRFREFPHFQWTGGLTLADLQSGKRPWLA